MVVTMLRRFLDRAHIFEFNLIYLMLVGLWPDKSWSKVQLKLYKIYEITIHAFTIGFMVLTIIGLYEHKVDGISRFLSNLDKSLVAYQYFFKSIVFIAKRERLRELISNIVNSGDTISKDRKQLMATHVICTTILVLSVVGSFIVMQLINFDMVLDAWMPFDAFKNLMNLILASQILGILLAPSVCRALAIQGIVCSLMMYVCDQLKELQQRLKALTYSQENENSMRQEFKDIIKKHIRLMG